MDELSQHHAKQIDQLLEKMKPIGPMTKK